MSTHIVFLSFVLSARVLSGLSEDVCVAGEGECAVEHYWPQSSGRVGSYAVASYMGPGNLSLAKRWTWYPPKGRYSEEQFGVVIDDQMNFYVSGTGGAFKVDSSGKLLWHYPAHLRCGASLMDDMLYINSKDGKLVALSMDTGVEIWKRQLCSSLDADSDVVGAHAGVVVSSSDGKETGGKSAVVGVNSTTGKTLWEFKTDSQLWCFVPLFTEDGSKVIFQDQIGGVYCLDLRSGETIWKTGYKGGWESTWVDGNPILANGVVFAVRNEAPIPSLANTRSNLRAYRLSDGEMLWQADFEHPCNSQPLVAPLGSDGRISVVMPIGAQMGHGGHWWYMKTCLMVFFYPGRLKVAFLLAGLCLGIYLGRGVFRKLLYPVVLYFIFALAESVIVTFFVLEPGPVESWNTDWPAFLEVLDFENGRHLGKWRVPPWEHHTQRAAGELLYYSWMAHGFQHSGFRYSVPTPFGSGAVDASGTVYILYQDGNVYSISNLSKDGVVDAEPQVSVADVGASGNNQGIALAPGLLAVTTIDGGLHVFRK